MSKIHAAWHVLNIQFYLLFTFISFREDLVKYLHCARAYRNQGAAAITNEVHAAFKC